MSAPTAVTEAQAAPEVTQAAPAPNTPTAPESTSAQTTDTQTPDPKAATTTAQEQPEETSPKVRELLGNVRNLARKTRALERENAELRAKQTAPAPTPTETRRAEPAPSARRTPASQTQGNAAERLAALPRESDAQGKEMVRFHDEWVSPEYARHQLELEDAISEQRSFRESFEAEQAQLARDRAAAEEAERTRRAEAAYNDMGLALETAVKQLASELFPNAPEQRFGRIERFLVGEADTLISRASEEAKLDGKDPLEMMLDPAFLSGVERHLREVAKDTFGAFAEAQLQHNATVAQTNTVTTPKGSPAVAPRMTAEEYYALPAGERRKLRAQIAQDR